MSKATKRKTTVRSLEKTARKLNIIDGGASTMALVPANSNLPERVIAVMRDLAEIEAAPMRDRILVCRADPSKEIRGIIIPDIAQETQGVGIVVAVGSGHYLDGKGVPLDVKPGDVVFFNKYAGTETEVGPHKLLRLREEEIEFRANGQKCMAIGKAASNGRS
jgi:chaperonin GroES